MDESCDTRDGFECTTATYYCNILWKHTYTAHSYFLTCWSHTHTYTHKHTHTHTQHKNQRLLQNIYRWNETWHRIRHGTHKNESWYTYEWVMPCMRCVPVTRMHTEIRDDCKIFYGEILPKYYVKLGGLNHVQMRYANLRMRYATRTNTSRHTYKWVVAHIRICHATRTYVPCHTYRRVTPHAWISYGKHTNESCHATRTNSPFSYKFIPNPGTSAPRAAPYYTPHKTHSLQCSHAHIVFIRIYTEIREKCATYCAILHTTQNIFSAVLAHIYRIYTYTYRNHGRVHHVLSNINTEQNTFSAVHAHIHHIYKYIYRNQGRVHHI